MKLNLKKLKIKIRNSILKPVNEIDNVAEKIAAGDLNVLIEYESEDELGFLANNFNKTVLRLKDYIKYIDGISGILDKIAIGDLSYELTYEYTGEFSKIKDSLIMISQSLNETFYDKNKNMCNLNNEYSIFLKEVLN